MKTLRVLICVAGLAVASLAGLAPAAWSQEVGSYPNATSPLSGTERILGDQSTSYPCTGCTVNLTPLQISNYTATQGGNFSVLFDNAGIMGGLIPGATGQYCLNWSSLTAAPTLVSCTANGTVNSGNAGDLSYYATTGTAVSDLQLSSAFTTAGGTLQPVYSINAQVGTTYTVVSTDCSKLITFSNASAVAVSLPQGTGTFAGCSLDVENLGVGTATITPVTSTINGAATLTILTNQGCSITSDGTNYQVSACTAVAPGGSSAFSSLTSGTNTAAAMLVGTGASLAATGTGTITATSTTEPINAQTGTTYTIASTDTGKLLTFNNASAIAVTLPAATTSGFGAGFHFRVQDLGAGTTTITPTTSTINGSATLVIPKNVGCSVNSDGTNYQVSACTSLGANAIYVNGVAVPTSATVLGSNSSNQLIAATTVTYLMDTGTTFTLGTGTGGCATATTLTGGAATGSFVCTGTAGASTQVINLPTATHGWYCSASDATSGVAWANEVGSTTTGKIGGTLTTTSDVVTFSCTGY